MLVVAGAFGTFMLFVLAGLGALAFTAMLDRSIGKERALLLWAVIVVALTWFLAPDAPSSTMRSAPSEGTVEAERVDIVAIAPPARPFPQQERNPFLQHSDTRPLPPVDIEAPPWLELPFPLPPTVPGPGAAARHLLRGEMPVLAVGDGSSIPEVPAVAFSDYKVVPEDVYDWITPQGDRRRYVYIGAIGEGGTWHEEGTKGYEERKWRLATGDNQNLQVRFAQIGPEKSAETKLAPTDVVRVRRQNVSDAPATQFPSWFLRRTVDNMYGEALRRAGIADVGTTEDISALRRAARDMGEVGRTGKEDKEGWRRAAELLERALEVAAQKASDPMRVEILVELIEAYRALRDEQAILRVLAAYARAAADRAEPWLMLGQFHLERMQLPEEALGYFRQALQYDAQSASARMGEGDALTFLERHREALEAYRRAGDGLEARTRRAEAALRLGDLDLAAKEAAGALKAGADDPRALLVRAAVDYAAGRVPEARDGFTRAAVATGGTDGGGLRWRAQALYGLGLSAWRLGQGDAALAAFEACETALRYGADPQRFGDETVSPDFGRALVAAASSNPSEMRTRLEGARDQAPEAAYVEIFAGVLAARDGDDTSAIRSFERALWQSAGNGELDAWLARTHARMAQRALEAGTPPTELADSLAAAVAFAARARERMAAVDPKAAEPHLREAWIWLQAQHVTPSRRRYEQARDISAQVLQKIDREQPGAAAIRAYAHFKLGDYDDAMRDLDDVLRYVPESPPEGQESPWQAFRTWASEALAAVKKWRSLEEKVVVFEDELGRDWIKDERSGLRALLVPHPSDPERQVLHFKGEATKDGSLLEPNGDVVNPTLFRLDTFERITLRVRIPTQGAQGRAVNNVTFGIQVLRGRGGGAKLAQSPGIGIFYDKGKVALRVGGGREEAFRDGAIHRVVPEMDWPQGDADGFVEVRIERVDAEDGEMVVYLGGAELFRDVVSPFRDSRSEAVLWMGGFGSQAQPFDVQVSGISVVREKTP
jgi:tetratricopeptide (TPR) repeat protein